NEYEPYGKLVGAAMEDGPGYTGHMADAATGLVYMQQRYYDPTIDGRFPSVDPVTPISPGGTFNRYWYANANPYKFTDPDGRLGDLCKSGGGMGCDSEYIAQESVSDPLSADRGFDSQTNAEDLADFRKNKANLSDVQEIVDTAVSKTTFVDYLFGKSGNNVYPSTRYVDTQVLGWIDLKHVISAVNNPFALIPTASYRGGAVLEVFQLIDYPKSALNVSDYRSNAVGEWAARRYYTFSWLTGKSKGYYVHQVLTELGAKQ